MGIVDKVMGSLSSNDHRDNHNSALHSTKATGPEALADGRPSETIIDDRIGGTHTRNVKDAVTHEDITRHAHHEVTPVVDRTRDEVDIHQKIQPVYDEQKQTTVHEHQAPAVHRERGEDISNEHAAKYQSQSQHHDTRTVADQTHSTSVNAPKVHEHVNRHIVEEIQPVIERHTQQTEHHHTTQPITEHYTKAPRVHDTVVNEPIHISAFTGNQGGIGQSHGARDALIDDKTGHHSSHTGTGLTGSHNNTTTGSGITGSHHDSTHGTGLTGSHHDSTHGTGLTGNHSNNTTSTHTDDHHKSSGGLLSKLTGK